MTGFINYFVHHPFQLGKWVVGRTSMMGKTPVTKDSFQTWHMDIIHQDNTLDTLHHLGHTHLMVTPQHLGDTPLKGILHREVILHREGILHRDTLHMVEDIRHRDTHPVDTHQQFILVHLLHIKVCIISIELQIAYWRMESGDLSYDPSSMLADYSVFKS